MPRWPALILALVLLAWAAPTVAQSEAAPVVQDPAGDMPGAPSLDVTVLDAVFSESVLTLELDHTELVPQDGQQCAWTSGERFVAIHFSTQAPGGGPPADREPDYFVDVLGATLACGSASASWQGFHVQGCSTDGVSYSNCGEQTAVDVQSAGRTLVLAVPRVALGIPDGPAGEGYSITGFRVESQYNGPEEILVDWAPDDQRSTSLVTVGGAGAASGPVDPLVITDASGDVPGWPEVDLVEVIFQPSASGLDVSVGVAGAVPTQQSDCADFAARYNFWVYWDLVDEFGRPIEPNRPASSYYNDMLTFEFQCGGEAPSWTATYTIWCIEGSEGGNCRDRPDHAPAIEVAGSTVSTFLSFDDMALEGGQSQDAWIANAWANSFVSTGGGASDDTQDRRPEPYRIAGPTTSNTTSGDDTQSTEGTSNGDGTTPGDDGTRFIDGSDTGASSVSWPLVGGGALLGLVLLGVVLRSATKRRKGPKGPVTQVAPARPPEGTVVARSRAPPTAAVAAAAPVAQGEGLLAGRYEMKATLGEGAFGVVRRAFDHRLGREVVVKSLHPHLLQDQRFRENALREARVAAQVSHPNVVTVHDAPEADGSVHVVMEFLEGRPLNQMLREGGALAPSEAIRITVASLEGLAALHAKGILHRDLKPGNIMILGDGTPKLLDLGIAKTEGEATDMSMTTMQPGTAKYMSPEQALGKRDLDHRTDLYTMGAILLELLQGRHYIDTESSTEVEVRIQIAQGSVDWDAAMDSVPESLRPVLRKALEQDPAKRYQTAAEFAEALREAGRRLDA